MVNFYDVLKVAKDATDSEIKAAFRKEALLHHPDKTMNADDNMFKSINEAYNTLSDPIKRSIYNDGLSQGLDEEGTDWKGFINNMMLAMWGVLASAVDMEKRTICVNVGVTLEDVFHARVKKVSIKVKRWCSSALNDTTQLFYVSLVNFKATHLFENMGDDCVIKSLPRSNVRINLELVPHDIIKVDNVLCEHDLYIEKKINLCDYYTREEFRFDVFGESVIVAYKQGLQAELVKGMGLPYVNRASGDSVLYGDLYVHFELVLPVFAKDEVGALGLESMLQNHFNIDYSNETNAFV